MPENPLQPYPRWGVWDDGASTWTLGELAASASHENTVIDDGGAAETHRDYLVLAPPEDAVRVEVEITWVVQKSGTGNIVADLTLEDELQTTMVHDHDGVSLTASGSKSITATYTLTSGTDWPWSREVVEATPPTGPEGVRYNIFSSADATSPPITSTCLSLVRAKVTEIELDGGLIYTPDPVPFGLEATAVSISQIDLVWEDFSGDVDGIVIERSLDGLTGWTEIETVAHGVDSYEDTGLDPATTYYYRVRAFSSVEYSDVASATTTVLNFYAVADTYDEPAANLVALDPQPRSKGVEITRRPHSPSSSVKDEELYVWLEWDYFATPAAYQSVLTQLGLLNALSNQITISARDQEFTWKRYNGIAVKPAIGVDGEWANYYLRGVKVLVKFLEEIG